ncbi:C-terminal binding protein [Candidatus Poribacteria bacterium]|nr:C-terminal binding protein [Candidatus Poribacteria bacterium]
MGSEVFKVVITDSYHPTMHNEKEIFKELNVDLTLAQTKNEDELMYATQDAHALMVQHAQITRRIIENLRQCKIIARYGVGYDNIDLKAATECGIMASNVPDYCTDEVSAHAIALLMACSRKLFSLDRSVRNKEWTYLAGEPIFKLYGQTLGIIGLGRIGKATAQKGIGLGFKVKVYDPYVSYSELDVKFTGLDDLLNSSDFVSLHCPLTEETRHMIGKDEFKKMKSSAFLINTARGPVVDSKALYNALEKDIIAGAGIDVTEPEPLTLDHPLRSLDNLIITPHTAWYSENSQKLLQQETARAVLSVLKGGKPRSLVNPEVLM